MHVVTNKMKINRKNSMGIRNLKPLLESIKFKSKKFSNLKVFLKNNLKDINRNWPKQLPKGIIHGDLFIDNIFFKKINFQELLISTLPLMIILCMKLLYVSMLFVLNIKRENFK